MIAIRQGRHPVYSSMKTGAQMSKSQRINDDQREIDWIEREIERRTAQAIEAARLGTLLVLTDSLSIAMAK